MSRTQSLSPALRALAATNLSETATSSVAARRDLVALALVDVEGDLGYVAMVATRLSRSEPPGTA